MRLGNRRSSATRGALAWSVAWRDACRGKGDRLALDREFGQRVDERCEELGLIVRPNVNMCVFSPPLVITEPQIDEMFEILEQAIRDVARSVAG